MTRNRHKKNRNKLTAPAIQHQAGTPVPAAQIMMNQIASGGAGYIEQNFERVMIDSNKLAEEPEFIDLHLDGKKAAEVTERWLKKYEKRLDAAEKKGQDTFQQVYDEMRIKVIDELAAPSFRSDVNNRLELLVDRLMASNEVKKLEIAMLLGPMLAQKSIPWGICGLILAIYNRAMQKTMQEFEEDQGVYDAVVEALNGEDEDTLDLVKMVESPEKLEQLAQKLFTANPALLERAEKQAWEMIDAFEEALAEGKVALDLFTEAELILPFQRLQDQLGKPVDQWQPSDEMRQRVSNAILQAVNDIMTPERFQRLRKDVKSTAKAWLSKNKKWAGALQLESETLNEEQYEEGYFILAAFLGQIHRKNLK